jgi:hypothetical protein
MVAERPPKMEASRKTAGLPTVGLLMVAERPPKMEASRKMAGLLMLDKAIWMVEQQRIQEIDASTSGISHFVFLGARIHFWPMRTESHRRAVSVWIRMERLAL